MFLHTSVINSYNLMVVGYKALSPVMHPHSKNKWWTINYLELSDVNNEEDLENELDLEVEAYQV